MKKLKLWLLILPFITIACSEDYTVKTKDTTAAASKKFNEFEKLQVSSDYLENPFDKTGRIYNEILDIFCHNDFKLNSIEGAAILIDSVAMAYPELRSLSADGRLHGKTQEMQWIINHDDPINEAILNSTLNEAARMSFSGFVQSFTLVADAPNESVHSMIVSYEQCILHSSKFSGNDKRIILTTTSIVRYSVERKRKDKDWDTSVTKIVSASLGANQDIALSLKMALAVGICQKKNITK